MPIVKFLLLLCVAFVTAEGYAAMTHNLPHVVVETWRPVLVAIIGPAWIAGSLAVYAGSRWAPAYERFLIPLAIGCGYAAIVSVMAIMAMQPPTFTTNEWWFNVALFSLPYIMSASILVRKGSD